MTGRRLATVAGFVLLAVLAGCFGPAEIPEDQLGESGNYTWDGDAAAAYTLDRSTYAAVFAVDNRTAIEVHNRDALGVESSIGISALQFRFPNGTVVNATHPGLNATRTQGQTRVGLPARNGSVAYTASRSGKQFGTPVTVPGAQEVTLPPGARVGVPLLSQVSPGNYTTSVIDGRMTVRWANRTDGSIQVQYYLQRDLLLFSVILIGGLVIGVGGALYYLRQIRRLESRRDEVGLDVDEDDDPRDRGPPPGMR